MMEQSEFRILIVEDNPFFRQGLRDSLRRLFPSMDIQEAPDGIVALQNVETFLPDLIFMDVQLPGENGFILTRKIKANHPGIVVIILTSHNTPEYKEAALRCGADRFITKGSLELGQIETLVKSFAPPG